MKSWRRSTHKQYGIYINKWFQFIDGKVDRSDKVSVNLVIEYLTSLHKSGLSYSALNTARSALSSFVCLDDDSNLGEHSLVKRFMRGVFNINPSFPRYSSTWDVRQVLDYLVSLGKKPTHVIIKFINEIGHAIGLSFRTKTADIESVKH